MSLKAKLEAVIYAAEEPVTLAQLAALFAADALEWKAQQQAASGEQAAEVIFSAAAAQTLPLLNGELAYLGSEVAPEAANVEIVPESAAAESDLDSEPPQEAAEEMAEAATELAADADPAVEPDTEEAPGPEDEAAAESASADDAEARRIARLRDREARVVIRQLLDELIATYASDERGVEIREIAGGYRMATKPEYHDSVRSFVKSLKPVLKLSLPALETLAVIAYKQPVTAPEVNEIRGVDSSAVFGTLLARKLIATAGRKQVIGRPILYKTTREFLLRFGLKDVTELPSMEEFEKMAAIELEEPEFDSPGDDSSAASPKPSLNPDLEFDRNGAEPELEDTGVEPECEAEPAVTAVSPNRTPAEPTPAEAAPAAPSPTEQVETETFQNER